MFKVSWCLLMVWQPISLYCWVIFCYVYACPFTCWKTSWLLLSFSNYVENCYKYLVCRFFCGHKFSTHLGKHLGMELLDPMVSLYLALQETATLFSVVVRMKMTGHTKVGANVEQLGHCSWQCKTVQPAQKRIWLFLTK